MNAMIVLENGSSFDGLSIGVPGERIGEVVLNTAVVGYQEMMTDPANAGKILVLTYPLIGNYGVAKKFYESERSWLSGLVIKESSRIYSNWQAEGSFGDFVKKEGVVAMSDVDTRTLAVNIRDNGEMRAIISTRNSNKDTLLKKLKSEMAKVDFIQKISVKAPSEVAGGQPGPRIGVLDLGMLKSFTGQLAALGCSVTLLPYSTSPDEIAGRKFDGLVISGGPEDDISMPKVVETVKAMIGKVPMLGISTGHQAIGLALGARIKKMRIGHHGVNYPIKGADSNKGEISVQNHSFVIEELSIKNRKGVRVTARNINDNTIEELESRALRFLSTQYYPASPGFDEVHPAFGRFLKMIKPVFSHSEVNYAKT